jgi:ParB family chromosome partitioning protein
MALGRGLGELLGEIESAYEDNLTSDNTNDMVNDIPIDKIKVNPYQPRKVFDKEKLQELSKSIQDHGILQPIILTKNNKNEYILIAGERRLRASKLVNLPTIKSIIVDIEDKKLREYSLIENIQRDDLNILEIAYSYSSLINEHKLTHEELANMVHKSRSSITNILRLLNLSVYSQQMVSSNKISQGHAKLIASLDENLQNKIIDSIIGQKLSVHQTQLMIDELKNSSNKTGKDIKKITNNFDLTKLKTISKKLQEQDLKVKISNNKFTISINSQEDIDKLFYLIYNKK